MLLIRPFVHSRLVKIFICIFWRVNQFIAGVVCAVKHIIAVVISLLVFVVITDIFEIMDSRIINGIHIQMSFIDSIILGFFDFSIRFIKLVIDVRIVFLYFYCLSIWSYFVVIRNLLFFHFNSLLYFLSNSIIGWIISVNWISFIRAFIIGILLE